MLDRVIVVVLDGVGAGELPDAADYGDTGSDTLVHVARRSAVLTCQIWANWAWGIYGRLPESADPNPNGSWGRMLEASRGRTL